MLDHLYVIVTAAATARRVPDLLQRLVSIGPRILVLSTPNTRQVLAPRELALALGEGGHRVVESYFDDAILPRPPRGVCLIAPCSFDSLNKLATGIADNLALSVAAEAIGRGTPVIVAVSLSDPLWEHPCARQSVATLRSWGVDVIEPALENGHRTLAPINEIVATVERALARSGSHTAP